MKLIQKQTAGLLLATAISVLLYVLFLYLTPRTEFYGLILLFTALFAVYGWWLFGDNWKERGKYILPLGILFRLIALFSLPLLSDDYYRFIWDGLLIHGGISPFEALPSAIMNDAALSAQLGLNEDLFNGLNSPDYFTIYPPVLQGVFAVASWIFPRDIYAAVLVMKLFVFLAECGSLILLKKIISLRKLPDHWLAIYAFNPLVIIELTGNLHFEALMIFFLLATWLLLLQDRWLRSVIPFALAVCSKLLPVMLMPLFIRRLGWKRTIIYGMAAGILTVLMFLPILDLETLQNLRASLGLYFGKFEFNASIWYIVREIGYQQVGWNIIQEAGKYLSFATVALILIYTLLEQKPNMSNLAGGIMWVFLIYFAFATIVHPWYITTLIAFGGLTGYRFFLLWSLLIPLTYITYQTTPYVEPLWVPALIYACMYGWILIELKTKHPLKAVI